MKLAISNIAWDQAYQPTVIELMRAAGFTGLEVAPSKIWPQPMEATESEVRAYATSIADQGLEIIGIQSALYGHPELKVFESDSNREQTLAYLGQMVQICAWLGGRVLVFGNPKNRRIDDLPMDQALDIATAFFRTLGDQAKQLEVVIGLEPNAADYGTDFMVNTAETVAVVERVDHPGVRLHLDLGVLQMNGEDITATIVEVGPSICHFHISQPFLKPIQDIAIHQQAAEALRQAHYQGWVSVEMAGVADHQVEELSRVLTTVGGIYGQD